MFVLKGIVLIGISHSLAYLSLLIHTRGAAQIYRQPSEWPGQSPMVQQLLKEQFQSFTVTVGLSDCR